MSPAPASLPLKNIKRNAIFVRYITSEGAKAKTIANTNTENIDDIAYRLNDMFQSPTDINKKVWRLIIKMCKLFPLTYGCVQWHG